MEELQYMVFSLGDHNYGINIIEIQEVNRLKEIKINKVPNTPSFVVGIMNLRGEIVPIIDLRTKFNLQEKALDKMTRIIIVRLDKKEIGFIVDSILYVLDTAEDKISLPPDDLKIRAGYVSGIVKNGKETIFLLSIDKILTAAEDNNLSSPMK